MVTSAKRLGCYKSTKFDLIFEICDEAAAFPCSRSIVRARLPCVSLRNSVPQLFVCGHADGISSLERVKTLGAGSGRCASLEYARRRCDRLI